MGPELLAEVRRMFAPEEGALDAARERAAASADPPSPEVGSLLRWATASCDAHAAVEVGGAGGVSGLWLLAGMAPGGVVTSIEPDPHAHGTATVAYQEAATGTRVRAIHGQPDAVLPRLSDGAYDVMLLQGPPSGYLDALEHARRLLRAGGILIVRGALRGGQDDDVLANFLATLAEDPLMISSVLPIDDGVILATRRATDGSVS